jgi:hypothetical protein
MAKGKVTTSKALVATAAKATKGRKARNPWVQIAPGIRSRKILESPKASAARMERSIQRDTCGLGHWRQPEEWDKEPMRDWSTRCGIDWNVPPKQQVDRPPAPPEDKRQLYGPVNMMG